MNHWRYGDKHSQYRFIPREPLRPQPPLNTVMLRQVHVGPGQRDYTLTFCDASGR